MLGAKCIKSKGKGQKGVFKRLFMVCGCPILFSMHIIFDLDIKYPGFYEKLTIEQKAVLDAIWHHVYDRIVYLFDEIEKEEKEGKPAKAIVIYLMNSPKAIQPRGYSDRLCEKINGSFNEKDTELLWDSVESVLKSFRN